MGDCRCYLLVCERMLCWLLPRVTARPICKWLVGALLLLLMGIGVAGAIGLSMVMRRPGDVVSLSTGSSLAETYGIPDTPPSNQLFEEISWLKECQLPNGAIAQTPQKKLVIPYFANLAAKAMVDYDPLWSLRYINWYLDNLNQPDRWGLYGTIYDFHVDEDRIVSTRNYDSADSYASTFLSLVARYHQVTGDDSLILARKESIDLVARVLEALMDDDGLVRVKPNSSTKYLMDNAENFRGLLDWAGTCETVGFFEDAVWCRRLAASIRQGIEEVLYNPKTGEYAWSLTRFGKRYPRMGRWYPDAVSQVFLISGGVVNRESQKASDIWDKFNRRFPSWEYGETGDDFPWAEIAVTSLLMEQRDKAEKFCRWVRQECATRDYPWHVMESSNLIRIHHMLGVSLPESEIDDETAKP